MYITLIITAIVILLWAICSTLMWAGLSRMRDGYLHQRIAYDRTSPGIRFLMITFAPLCFAVRLLEALFKLWKYLAVIALMVAACVYLTGCQVNVITAPHATFMVDSVTAESIDQGIYERNAE